MEYQQIGAWRHGPVLVRISPSGGSWNVTGAGCWVVFGTLLGPEATGPGCCGLWVVVVPGLVFLVSWLHRSHGCLLWWGRVCGVCGTGLLFENYIVDASIFYKKQFPRI